MQTVEALDQTDLENIRALVLNHHCRGQAVFGTMGTINGVWYLTGDKLLALVDLVRAQHKAIASISEAELKMIDDLAPEHCHHCARTFL